MKMVELTKVPQGSLFLELGSGTGRLSLLLAKVDRFKCIGIDCISPFVEHANRIAQKEKIHNVRFIESDMFAVSWSEADLLYVTATAFSEDQVCAFEQKCLEMKIGAKILSLTHKPSSDALRLLHMDVLEFSWGASTVFLCERR